MIFVERKVLSKGLLAEAIRRRLEEMVRSQSQAVRDGVVSISRSDLSKIINSQYPPQSIQKLLEVALDLSAKIDVEISAPEDN